MVFHLHSSLGTMFLSHSRSGCLPVIFFLSSSELCFSLVLPMKWGKQPFQGSSRTAVLICQGRFSVKMFLVLSSKHVFSLTHQSRPKNQDIFVPCSSLLLDHVTDNFFFAILLGFCVLRCKCFFSPKAAVERVVMNCIVCRLWQKRR